MASNEYTSESIIKEAKNTGIRIDKTDNLYKIHDNVNSKYIEFYIVGYGLVGYTKPTNDNYDSKIKKSYYDDISVDLLKNNNYTLKNNALFNPKTIIKEDNQLDVILEEIHSPQQRYRFFVSRLHQSLWYFAISLDRDEYTNIVLSNEKNYSENTNQTITIRNSNDAIKNTPFLNVTIPTLFKFYNVIQTSEFSQEKFDDIIKHTSISIFPITLFRASYFASCKKINNRTKIAAIVGDACIGVNFFSGTGVNGGIKCAKLLVDTLHKNYKNILESNFELIKKACIDYNKSAGLIFDKILDSSAQVTPNYNLINKDINKILNKYQNISILDFLCKSEKNIPACSRRNTLVTYLDSLSKKFKNENIKYMIIQELLKIFTFTSIDKN